MSILVGVVTVAASIYDRIPETDPAPRVENTPRDADTPLMQADPAANPATPAITPSADVPAAVRPPSPSIFREAGAGGHVSNATDVQPSFPCNLAGHAYKQFERAICSSEALARADNALATLYADARLRADDSQRASLRAAQREWMSSRSACSDDDCLLAMYQQRSAELAGLYR